MENKEKKKFDWKTLLISLAITLVMLAAVMGAQYWFTSTTRMEFDNKWMWIGNLVGGVIMFFIVRHFVKGPKDDKQ